MTSPFSALFNKDSISKAQEDNLRIMMLCLKDYYRFKNDPYVKDIIWRELTGLSPEQLSEFISTLQSLTNIARRKLNSQKNLITENKEKARQRYYRRKKDSEEEED